MSEPTIKAVKLTAKGAKALKGEEGLTLGDFTDDGAMAVTVVEYNEGDIFRVIEWKPAPGGEWSVNARLSAASTAWLAPGEWASLPDGEPESLTLKWGSLKAWQVRNQASVEALLRYFEAGRVSASAMLQQDTEEQTKALCDLIDVINVEKVYMDWDGVHVSKDVAKNYLVEYAASRRRVAG